MLIVKLPKRAQRRTVRGPMTILRELWENEKSDDEFVESYQYVVDLRNRIESTCEIARENLKDSKDRYKKHYDRKAKVRS